MSHPRVPQTAERISRTEHEVEPPPSPEQEPVAASVPRMEPIAMSIKESVRLLMSQLRSAVLSVSPQSQLPAKFLPLKELLTCWMTLYVPGVFPPHCLRVSSIELNRQSGSTLVSRHPGFVADFQVSGCTSSTLVITLSSVALFCQVPILTQVPQAGTSPWISGPTMLLWAIVLKALLVYSWSLASPGNPSFTPT